MPNRFETLALLPIGDVLWYLDCGRYMDYETRVALVQGEDGTWRAVTLGGTVVAQGETRAECAARYSVIAVQPSELT